MIGRLAAAFLAFVLAGAPASAASSHPRTSSHKSGSTRASNRKARPKKARAVPVGRHSSGRVKRSPHARAEFMRRTGYPHGRPGYVVDHIIPLACGGADAPTNMQWQTVAAGKMKDRSERKGCR